MMVAPLLLWLGAPVVPVLRGMPAVVRRALLAACARPPGRRLGRALTHPALGWIAFAVMTWAWHAPPLYELALASPGWHHVEHACFLGSALLFWWPVVQPWPSRPRWARWAMVPYLGLAEVQKCPAGCRLHLRWARPVSRRMRRRRARGHLRARGSDGGRGDHVGPGRSCWCSGGMADVPAACRRADA